MIEIDDNQAFLVSENARMVEEFPKTPGMIVVDIGAYVGTLSIPFAQQGARVYAYEANPLNYAKLCRNIHLLGLQQQISAFNVAVTDVTGALVDIRGGGTGGMSSLEYASDRKVIAEISTLDICDILEALPHVDYLKIDIEGAEWRFIRQNNEPLKKLMKEKVRFINFETHELLDRNFYPEGGIAHHPIAVEFFSELGFKTPNLIGEDTTNSSSILSYGAD